MRKIFLSVLLASAAFGFASAEKYAEIDGLWYWMDAGTQIAKPCKATQVWPVPEGMTFDDLSNTVYAGDVVIPASFEYDGTTYQVTEIFSSCFADAKVTSVTLPESILVLGQSSFARTTELTELVIPNSVTTINAQAFMSSGLKTLTLGSGVESVGMMSFMSCKSLTDMYVLSTTPPTLGGYNFNMTTTSQMTLHVPADALEAYKGSDWAKNFAQVVAMENGGGDVEVTGITLDRTSYIGIPGETFTLNATVEPEDATDKTVEWSTSDESVATVADGLVTLVADGNATITAKCGEFTVTCSVIVDSTNVGIEAIEAGDDVKARYFNLQGIEVINPAEGQMVIERKGDKVHKMVF